MSSVSSAASWPLRCGARTLTAILLGLIPGWLVLIFPVYPLYTGDIQGSSILLSNIMAAGATYQSIYIMGFGVPMVVMIFIVTQAMEHFKSHGMPKGLVNAYLFLNTVAMVGLVMLLAFCFESQDGSITLETQTHSILHNVGAMIYFMGAGAACWVYATFLLPEGERRGLIHPADAGWSRILTKQMGIATVIFGGFRSLHLTYPMTWAIPTLFIECYVIGLALGAAVLGHLRLLMNLDAVDPLLDLNAFAYSSKAADGKLS